MDKFDAPFFVTVIKGQIILWDFERHDQYELTPEFAAEILSSARSLSSSHEIVPSSWPTDACGVLRPAMNAD